MQAGEWVMLIGALITGFGGFSAALVAMLKFRNEAKKGNRADALAECYSLIGILQNQVKENAAKSEREMESVRGELSECRESHVASMLRESAALGRIDMLEESLTMNKIPFRKWNPPAGPGSGVHPKLPPQPPAELQS